MDEKIREFLKRLKTVKDKACDERVTTKTIYDRIAKGVYDSVVVGGIKFIIEPEDKQ